MRDVTHLLLPDVRIEGIRVLLSDDVDAMHWHTAQTFKPEQHPRPWSTQDSYRQMLRNHMQWFFMETCEHLCESPEDDAALAAFDFARFVPRIPRHAPFVFEADYGAYTAVLTDETLTITFMGDEEMLARQIG